MPAALAGRDVCGRAPTGSGKTLAFGIPARHRGSARPPRPAPGPRPRPHPRAGRPDRAGAHAPGRPRKRRVAAVYGGVGFGRQLPRLRRGVDIVVACPGRLADLVEQGEYRPRRRRARRRRRGRPHGRHGLPARGPPPARPGTPRPPDAAVLGHPRRRRRRAHPPLPARPAAATRWRRPTPTQDRRRAPVLAGRPGRAGRRWPPGSSPGTASHVVFCRTKRGADRLARQLARPGCRAAAIHGDRSQTQRERALAAFSDRQGPGPRGHRRRRPGHPRRRRRLRRALRPADGDKDYVHRSGRTGRAGAGGTVVSLVEDHLVGPIKLLQRQLGFPAGAVEPDLASFGGVSVAPWRAPVAVQRTPKSPKTPVAGAAPAGPSQGPRRTEPLSGATLSGRMACSSLRFGPFVCTSGAAHPAQAGWHHSEGIQISWLQAQ